MRTDTNGILTNPVRWYEIFQEHAVQRGKIVEELATTRDTMHRLLSLIGGMERMRILTAELECVQRASLDARNAFGLAAETASCLPRVWDHKDPLRDYNQRQ